MRVPVLIVGGGPVGLATALELGWRGVRCLLVEQADGSIVDAKMFATGIRTVEFCRRWGIAEQVKNWGFPPDFPFDNQFVTSLTGYELGRISVAPLARREPFAQSPERFAHCPQFMFDPILAARARSFRSVTLRYRCRLESFEDRGDRVLARMAGDEQVEADWLVACDGFSSATRKALGIEMSGREFIDRSINIMFRTPNLASLHDKGNAGRYVLIGPEGPWASLVPADGAERWRLMVHGGTEFEPASFDAAAAVRRALGRDFAFEILGVGHWVRRRMVAESYGRGRVFLAGDAVHVMPPNGGLGMNTGIGDAVDLGWKLSAMVEGWGGRELMKSYEAERRPVGIRACDEAMRNYDRYGSRRAVPHVMEDSPEGERTRAELGARLAAGNRLAWENPLNTHLGYRYDDSPICIADGAPPPEPEDSRLYEQTSHPGCRAPHAWLADGRSTLDLFGRGFTLLVFGDVRPDPMLNAAKERQVPLKVERIDDPAIARLYERALVLVRPDGHVAWRGDTLPAKPQSIIDQVRGGGPQ